MSDKSKARIIKSDVQYIYIPADSLEKFLRPSSPTIQHLARNDIFMAGLSWLTKGYRVERYHMSFHLLLYTLGGQATLNINASKCLTLHAGDLFVAPCNSSYTYWTERDWYIAWLHLSECARWDRLFGKRAYVREALWDHEIEQAMSGYIREAERKRIDTGNVLNYYVELMANFVSREMGDDDPAIMESRCVLNRIRDEIEKDLKHPWRAEEIGKIEYMSRKNLSKITVALTGLSPMQMVKAMRIERACELLVSTTLKLTAIAYEVGYMDQFSFSKAFKKYISLSPKQYRDEMRRKC